MSFQCPNCGRPLKVIPLSASAPMEDWQKREMRQYAIGADVPPGVEYERTQPISQMSVTSYVTAPLIWSLVTAVLLAIAGLVVAVLSQGSRFPLPLWSPVLVFIVVLILAWFSRSDIATKLLYVTERITGQDLNGDDRVGEPSRLEIAFTERTAGGFSMKLVELPEGVTLQMAQTWAKEVTSGDRLAYDRWAGEGGLFTRPQYGKFCSQLIKRGFVRNRGGNIGYMLTKKGEVAVADFANTKLPD